jgi:hypothetical protein
MEVRAQAGERPAREREREAKWVAALRGDSRTGEGVRGHPIEQDGQVLTEIVRGDWCPALDRTIVAGDVRQPVAELWARGRHDRARDRTGQCGT